MKHKITKLILLIILAMLISIAIAYAFVKNTIDEEKVSMTITSAVETNSSAKNSGYKTDLFGSLSPSEKKQTIDGTVYAPTDWAFRRESSSHAWLIPWHDGFQIYCIEVGGNVYCYDGPGTACTTYETMETYIGYKTYTSCTYTKGHASNPYRL